MGTWSEGREALSLAVLGGAEWWHTRAWLLAHQLSFSAASPDLCMWPAMSVLCPSGAHIPLLTLQVAQLRADMAMEVQSWRGSASLRSSSSLDIPLGHGSAGGTQQVSQQR